MAQKIPIKIPTYINTAEYNPAVVLPRIYFYNGQLECEPFYFNGVKIGSFPYFDNYNVVSGNFPTPNSNSLLFNNEDPAYGAMPTNNLYTEYWSKYVELLYNPRTRLMTCDAIIPLADYFKMGLNDIVEFRGNYWHLRAINDYNLKNGECSLQLLGPVIADTISSMLFPCNFSFEQVTYIPPTTTTTTTIAPTTTTSAPTTTTTGAPTTTTTMPPPVGGYNYYAVASNCCNPGVEDIVGVVAITSSLGIYVEGQTLAGNTYTSSTGGHCVSVKYLTGSTTPLLFVIEESQVYSNTYGLGQCNSCNRDYLPTPSTGVCLDYTFVNSAGTLSYVSCSGTPVTASLYGGSYEFCSKTTPSMSYAGVEERFNTRVVVNCANCGTY